MPTTPRRFVRAYYANVAPEDLVDRNEADLAGAALAHWSLARVRRPGEPKLRVYTPSLEEHGWESPHTVVETVVDDMPFLVDSVSMEVSRHGHAIPLGRDGSRGAPRRHLRRAGSADCVGRAGWAGRPRCSRSDRRLGGAERGRGRALPARARGHQGGRRRRSRSALGRGARDPEPDAVDQRGLGDRADRRSEHQRVVAGRTMRRPDTTVVRMRSQ
jgi:hypothetical protein